MTTVKTDDNYWDCECRIDYIHHISQKKCPLCGADEEDCPPSRVNEIEAWRERNKVKP